MNNLSSCCNAPVAITIIEGVRHCSNCSKPCAVTTPEIPNNSPVNASTVEELRKEFDEKIGNWLDYTHKVGYHNCPDKETAWNWFLTHTSALSDSTLREVFAEIGGDEPVPEIHKNCESCSCIDSHYRAIELNEERQRIRAIINSKLSK